MNDGEKKTPLADEQGKVPIMPHRGRFAGQTDVVARKQRTDFKATLLPECDDGIMKLNIDMLNLPKLDTGDREQVVDRINWYFKKCQEYMVKPGVAGLCAAIGISRAEWWNWGNGTHRDYKDIVERVRAILDSFMECYMQQGRINPVAGIFLMKNNFGYTDKNEVVVTPNQNPLGEGKSAEELARKYSEDAYIDDLEEKYPEIEDNSNTSDSNDN